MIQNCNDGNASIKSEDVKLLNMVSENSWEWFYSQRLMLLYYFSSKYWFWPKISLNEQNKTVK